MNEKVKTLILKVRTGGLKSLLADELLALEDSIKNGNLHLAGTPFKKPEPLPALQLDAIILSDDGMTPKPEDINDLKTLNERREDAIRKAGEKYNININTVAGYDTAMGLATRENPEVMSDQHFYDEQKRRKERERG